MLIEIGCGSEKTRADLKDGVVRVGGAKADEVRIPGLPPSLVTLRIDGERLTLTSTEPLGIGRSIFPSHLPRLVIAGELVHLAKRVTVRQVPAARRDQTTAAVMRSLIEGTCAVEETRAATLTCLTGADAGNVIPLAFDQMLIGRGDDCQLQIRDRSVSRRHARVTLREGRTLIEDLRGANGTWVNGNKVKRRAMLQPGDVIELGQTLLRYDAPQVAVAVAPPSVLVDASLVVTAPDVVLQAHEPAPKWFVASAAGGALALLFGVAAVLSALL